MRKTSFGLGLAGTILAFVIGIIVLIAGIATSAVSYLDWENISEDMGDMEITVNGEDVDIEMMGDYGEISGGILGAFGAYFIVGGIGLLIAGVLGIIGSVITRKRQSVAAGILLLIGAILSIISIWGLFATALLVPAGILAFLKDKKNEAVPMQPQAPV